MIMAQEAGKAQRHSAPQNGASGSSVTRIAYVIDSLRRHGTQTALVYLANGLEERAYEQRVYCLNDVVDPDIRRRLASCGAGIVVIGKRQLVTFQGIKTLILELRRWQPDIVQTFLPFGDVIGRTVGQLAGAPVIVSSIRARNIDKHRWQFLLDRITLRWVDKVVFNSRRAIPFSLRHEGVRAEQVVYIPNCVGVEQMGGSATRAEVRSQMNIPPEARVIGTVGRLYRQKGHHYLLSAFEKVRATVPNALLLLIGGGPLCNQLEAEAARMGIAGQTRFLGERADVPELLAAIDVYVQPSIYEGMPNALMEAMAAGKPVIGSNVDGIQELVTHGETGWLVEPCNPQALADRIIYAFENADEAARIGAAAIQRMRSEFSIERMITAYDGLYRDLLSQKQGFLR